MKKLLSTLAILAVSIPAQAGPCGVGAHAARKAARLSARAARLHITACGSVPVALTAVLTVPVTVVPAGPVPSPQVPGKVLPNPQAPGKN